MDPRGFACLTTITNLYISINYISIKTCRRLIQALVFFLAFPAPLLPFSPRRSQAAALVHLGCEQTDYQRKRTDFHLVGIEFGSHGAAAEVELGSAGSVRVSDEPAVGTTDDCCTFTAKGRKKRPRRRSRPIYNDGKYREITRTKNDVLREWAGLTIWVKPLFPPPKGRKISLTVGKITTDFIEIFRTLTFDLPKIKGRGLQSLAEVCTLPVLFYL